VGAVTLPARLPGRARTVCVAHLAPASGPPPIRLGGPDPSFPYHRGATVLEAFFEALLIVVCIGVAAFAGLTVKKLYQGQR
jgi:hypothetical protein